MRKYRKLYAAVICAALLAAGLSGCAGQVGGGFEAGGSPVAIHLWHYYNGFQQKSFDLLVQEFNRTVGAQKGILVEANSYGSVSELNEKVLDAVYERVGAEEIPDGFAAYADTVYEINRMGKVADLSRYLTEEEQEAYVSGYLEEGRFEENGGFKIFPIAKATEVLTLNKTEWDRFSAATGASQEDLTTWERIASLAERYYRWTDGQTPDVAEDGRAFFGRDAFANYIIIGSEQLGTELFEVQDGSVRIHMDETVMRRLWDNYYVPYINGYFSAVGKFRSDDVRTGDLVACVGSTSAATFFPTEVTRADGSAYPIEVAVFPLPNFEGSSSVAVQQGAGMVVTKSTPQRERATAEFLKWFTQPEQNTRFAMGSGYLPVTYAANERAIPVGDGEGSLSPILRDTLTVGMEMTRTYRLYTNKPFEKGSAARTEVSRSMWDRAVLDRKAVLELMAAGSTRADAVAQYDTDENFESWLGEFRAALAAAAE